MDILTLALVAAADLGPLLIRVAFVAGVIVSASAVLFWIGRGIYMLRRPAPAPVEREEPGLELLEVWYEESTVPSPLELRKAA